jgi:ADP-glucose pyrophosphorylase
LIHTKISAYLDSRLEEQITIQAEFSHAFQCTLHNINIKWQLLFLFLIISFWTFLRNCIIDKNAKIGRNVIITNADVSAISKSCFH